MKHTKITAGRRLVSVLTALLLILAMTASALPQEAWAATDDTFNDGDFTFTITDENTKTVTLSKYNGNSYSVTIPDTVTNSNRTPYTVTSIGRSAFDLCTSLQSVFIPGSVTSIGRSAFSRCTSLTSVTIPGSVTSIGNSAFESCGGLQSVTISEGVTSIGKFAFKGSNLASVHIPASVTSISTDMVFSNCASLSSITVAEKNNNYESIDGILFNKGKTILLTYPAGKSGDNYAIPDSVTTIKTAAFYGCSKLTSVTIPGSVVSINTSAFQFCSSLPSLTIPNSVTSIENGAFWGCSSLQSVTIPDSVTSIENHTFYDCSSLTSVTIPGSVTSIGDYGFYGCSKLQSVTIPDSVTSISANAFQDCNSLTSVLVMFDKDPKDTTINNQITGSITSDKVIWYRGWRSFADSTADIIDITVAPGSSYDLSARLGITDTIYKNQSGSEPSEDPGITIPAFTLSGNTSTNTKLDGSTLTLGTDETGTLLLKTYGKTIRVNNYQPPAVSYWCTLTADALSFPEMEAGDTPQPQPLQLHCSGNTGASITKVALSGTDFLLDDSKAEAYVGPGNTNSTYLITPKADLAPGTYKATVTVTYSYGQTTEADVTLTVTEAKQEAPAKLTAKSKNYRTITLSWTAASRAEKYQVYRATKKSGTYKRISTTSKTALNNIRLTTGKTYYYKVRAYRTVNGKKVYSPFTNIASAKPKPSAPSFSLKAGKGRITVSWKGVSGATGYRVYRASSKNGRFVLVKDSRGKARSYTNAGLRSKKTYYYKLRAYRIVNGKKIYSSYTEVKTIKTR